MVSHAILPSVEQIEPQDWLRLFGDLPEGRAFFQTLEASRLEGFNFCYALVRAGGRLELIAPLFWSDLDLGMGVEGGLQTALRIARRAFPRLLIARTVFCGSPFGETGSIGIRAGSPDQPALVAELVRAMRQVCREQGLSLMLFKDFPAGAAVVLAPLAAAGFFRGESFPNVVVPLPYGTMDEYLASLSPNARKDLRRKVRQAQADGPIEVRVADSVADLLEPVYALYLNTYHGGTVRFEKLTREYFLAAGRGMAGRARFFLFFVHGRLVCFNLCFQHGDQLIDKFIGLDYAVARKLNLYFYTWHHNVAWCIAHGVRQYQVGQTDHEAKVRLGGKLVPLYFYARHAKPWLNFPLRLAARFLAPQA
jgi:predicted N-acyltransferase